MGSDTNGTHEDDSSFNPIGRAMIALVFGIGIVIILNLFHRSGHFTLVSAFFGILLYGLFSTLDWLRERKGERKKSSHDLAGAELKTLKAIIARIWRGLLIIVLKALVGFLGLLLLPDQQSLLFAAINGVLGYLLCKSLFDLGLLVILLLVGHKMGFQPPVVDGGNGSSKPIS